MRVYIYACEGTYGGLHGMNRVEVVDDIVDLQHANEYGLEMAEDVVESYGLFDEDECDIEPEYIWYIYPIKADVELSTKELNKLCSTLGDELFREKYCEDEMWEG